MVDDMVDEVDFVDRKNWRPKGGMASDDDSDSDESDYTESQPAHSLEPANPLNKVWATSVISLLIINNLIKVKAL